MNTIRYAITEPRDFAYWVRGWLRCRLFRRHGPVCEGRPECMPAMKAAAKARRH